MANALDNRSVAVLDEFCITDRIEDTYIDVVHMDATFASTDGKVIEVWLRDTGELLAYEPAYDAYCIVHEV